ncbi:hypothetical protein [Paenibacillus naphthalenovorans]|uniref:hypothetical protein n=1 Tax=Paenibacillus naphthalenovorans TaxID=162209 RepID=UPI003D2DADFF
MSMFTKTGAAAAASAQSTNEKKESAIVSFGSGTTYKVRFKSLEDSVEYYGYGIYDKVKTFVPKNPAVRNDRGFIESNPTVWDRAEQYYRDLQRKAKDAGDEKAAEEYSKLAYLYKGKPRYLIAFTNLEDGKDVVIDLTKKQASGVLAAINKYAKKLDKLAFELAKTGSSTSTTVTLTPILDMDEDLTDKERANFEKAGDKPFDFELFETCLYVADEAEQTKNLVIAGFDIGLIGLSLGAPAPAADEAPPITGDAPDVKF